MKKVGFVCFGEVNTPFERLQLKHDEALGALQKMDYELTDAGVVIDDVKYETADRAVSILRGGEYDCLILCVAGWIPTHAVIRVTDGFRHLPMVLWGLAGWYESGYRTGDDHHERSLDAYVESHGGIEEHGGLKQA